MSESKTSAEIRTIRANGGVYESTVTDSGSGEVLKRFWIEL